MLVSLLLVAGFAVSAEAATVSGTVTNNSGIAGRVYLSGQWSNGGNAGWGISMPMGASGTANYSIRGVQDGSYIINAFLDTQTSGMQHANDPVGTSAMFNVTGGAPAPNIGITLNNPPAVGLQPPTGVNVVAGDQSVLVTWDAAKDTNGSEIATSYKVYWSTSANPGPSNMTGGGSSPVIPSNDNYIRAFGNGASLYFAVTATLNGVESAPRNANNGLPVTIGAPSGGVTVSGTVTTTGATLGAATPLYVALGAGNGPPTYIARIAAPLISQGYSIPGVQPGSYGIYAIIDMNNNGVIDLGDISNTEGNGVPVTVSGTTVTSANVSLVAANALVIVKTNHYRQGVNESYGVSFEVSEQMKRPVNVAVSGPQVAIMDMGLSSWGAFEAWPGVPNRPTLLPSPDTYSFDIAYSDGTNTGVTPLTAPVTGIVDSFATPVSPVGYVPFPVPLPASFTWTAPLSPPNPHTYSFWLGVPNFDDSNTNNMPSNTTSVNYSYNFVEDNQYQWNIAVKDRLGNNAQSQVNFAPTTSPGITGFTPTSGIPGTQVTISGFNFGATPANNQVSFNSTAASIISATSSSMVVSVPSGASTGEIVIMNLTSGKANGNLFPAQFTVLPTITMSGTIRDSAGVLAGATIELPGNTLVSATSGADGTYTLAGLPYNQEFSVKVSKTGYADEYSKSITTTTDLTAADFRLYSAAEVAGLGITPGLGVIQGKVRNGADGTAISGATVAITASSGSYTVLYANATTSLPEAGSATTANGMFYILNVTPGDIVTVQAAAAGFSNASAIYTAHANAVTVGGIGLMDNTRPTISAFALTTPYNNLTVPVSSFTAADNAAVTGYLVTESSATPSLGDSGWSVSAPATFTFSAGEGSRTAYGWARDAAGNISLGYSAAVTIDLTAPTTTASPVGGTQTVQINVTLTASEPATIYYTTNGSAPVYPVAGQTNVYTAPIPVSANTTIRYFARDLAGNIETPIKQQAYFYGTPTTLSLGLSSGSIVFGELVNATATITSGAGPTGTVQFLINGIPSGTPAILSGTTASVIMFGFQVSGSPYTISAVYSGDATYASSSDSAPLTVSKLNQTITVNNAAPASAVFNNTFTVGASVVSGLPVTYSSGSPTVCTNVDSTFTMVSGTGTCIVQYDQAGNTNYNAAPQVTSTNTVAVKANQAISITTAAPLSAALNTSFTVAATAPAGAVTYSSGSPAVCTNVGATFTMNVSSGTCVVQYDQAGSGNYNGALRLTSSTTATNLAQSINVTTAAPASAAYNSQFTVAATATSNLPVAYTSGSPTVCTNAGAVFTMIAPSGDCIVRYNQAGNVDYAAALQLTSITAASKAPATVILAGLSQTYTGSQLSATATTNPPGLTVDITYNGLATVPANAGSYAVVGTINDTNYQGSSTGTLVIAKVAATVTLASLSQTYTGSPLAATATTNPAGKTVDFTYNGLATPPTNAGSYAVVGTINDTNYQGSATGTLVIAKAAQTVVTVNAPASATYSQAGLAAVATGGNGTGAYSYSAGSSTACSVNATSGALTFTSGTGNCAITATRQADANYNVSAVSAADTVTINKATATVTLSNLVRTYTGSPQGVTATTNPTGLAVGITYNGSSTVPTNAGNNYAVVATINSANYQGTANGTLVIGRAAATVTVSNLTQTADGTPKGVTVTTAPANRPVTVTYNGSATLPSAAGTYNVSVTITDSNYTGSATASLKLLAFGDIAGLGGQPDGVVDLIDARNYLLMSLRLLNPPAYTGNLLLAPIVGGVPTAIQGSRSVNILDVRAMLEKIVGLW
jgi:hypothetical protein